MSFEIGKVLNTEESLSLNIANIITGRTFFTSITRFGKSWNARKVVEESFGHAGIIILDTEGEYISLRERFPVMIIGKDVPLQVETAEFMAEKVLEANVSVIIDLSMVEVEVGKEYVDKFLRRFFFLETTAKKPYLVVVEEADELAGEKGIATSTCVEILRNITKKGAKRGIGILLIAHRPAWVSKGVLSQCVNKAIGRIDWPADLEVLQKFARIPHQIIERLPTLEKGEFCFAGDWVNQPTFVKVGQVKTTHLGMTPEVIPQAPKELESVIESLQKALPQVIERIKPTVVSTAEIESKIKSELERKFKEKTESILRTADEKAERKYKVTIDNLRGELEKLSRAQALQPVAPITDVLAHPIISARMLQLDDKARDLLTWIEREPGHTREELAARMVSSKDVVASTIDKINRVFQLQVVVDDGGRPLRYKSMLKRLFLTDVAKREIEELGRLQERNKVLEEELTTLRPIAEQSATLRGEVEHARRVNKELAERLEKLGIDMKELKSHNEALAKENEGYRKIREGFQALGVMTPSIDIEERLNTMKQEFLDFLKAEPVHIENLQVEVEVEKKIEELVEQKVSARLAEQKGAQLIAQKEGVIPTSIELEHKVTHFDLRAPKEHVQAETTTLPGRILYTILKDPSFWGKRHSPPEVATKLNTYGWTHDSKGEVGPALLELCQKGVFTRIYSTSSLWWYTLTPEAKELIKEAPS